VIFSGVQPQATAVLASAGLGSDAGRVEYAPDYRAALVLAAAEAGSGA
jgi:hypothetical protein